jgi:hypothetical protein
MTYRSIWLVLLVSGVVGIAAAQDPESLQSASIAALWAALLTVSLYRITKRKIDGSWLARVIVAGLFLRFAMVFVHLAVGFWFYKGELDFPGYHATAVRVGRGLLTGDWVSVTGRDFGTQATEQLMVFFYLMSGPGIVGIFLLSAMTGFLGSYLFLCAFEAEFPKAKGKGRRFLALSLFLLPSLAFWGILLGKESWMLFFLGGTSYAVAKLLHRFRFRYFLGLVVSLTGVTLIRLPVGAVLAFAVGCAWLLKPGQNGPAAILRPVRFTVLAMVTSIIVLSIMASYLGKYGYSGIGVSLPQSALQVGLLKHTGLSGDPTAGVSSVAIGLRDPSLRGVLAFLPGGMFTFLFRPFIFEAHHALALAAGLESTFFLILMLWRYRSLVAAMRFLFSRPFFIFCVTAFFLLTATLSLEANFGVIVRHRTMVLPFLLILLSVPAKPKLRRGLQSPYPWNR